jgi:Uma2 family endonuclease
MTTATAPIAVPPADQGDPPLPSDQLYRLSVEQYHEMIQKGILSTDDRVELLEGWLIRKMSKNPPHRIATKLLTRALEAVVPAGWYVDAQEPITTDTSEPEPDVAVIRGDTRDYPDRHPGPEHLALLVEIADSSLARDRGIKRRVYARANVPVYWIVDLVERRVVVYTGPSGPAAQPAYRDSKPYAVSESVPVVVDGREVSRILVRDILP